jgi:hypothetical protein
MNVNAKQIDAMWEKMGFRVDSSRADVKADLWIGGRFLFRTYRSHGSGKLSGQIPTFIRQKMRLNEGQFMDAIKCPLSRADYYEILRAKGLLS